MKAIIRDLDNVVLQIISSQSAYGETTRSELTTTGHLSENPTGVHTLTFKEIFGEGKERSTSNSVITVYSDGKLTLERTGLYNTHLIFEQDKRYNSAYTTPYGTMDMGVYTKTAQFRREDEITAFIELQYALDTGAEIFTENTMKIIIKKRNENK